MPVRKLNSFSLPALDGLQFDESFEFVGFGFLEGEGIGDGGEGWQGICFWGSEV